MTNCGFLLKDLQKANVYKIMPVWTFSLFKNAYWKIWDRFAVYSFTNNSNQKISKKEISYEMGINAKNFSKQINTLEKQGFIKNNEPISLKIKKYNNDVKNQYLVLPNKLIWALLRGEIENPETTLLVCNYFKVKSLQNKEIKTSLPKLFKEINKLHTIWKKGGQNISEIKKTSFYIAVKQLEKLGIINLSGDEVYSPLLKRIVIKVKKIILLGFINKTKEPPNKTLVEHQNHESPPNQLNNDCVAWDPDNQEFESNQLNSDVGMSEQEKQTWINNILFDLKLK